MYSVHVCWEKKVGLLCLLLAPLGSMLQDESAVIKLVINQLIN